MTTIEISPTVYDVTVQNETIEITVDASPVEVRVGQGPGTAELIAYDGSAWTGTKPTNVDQALDLIEAGGIGGTTSASSVLFTPADSTKWRAPAPTTVAQALDAVVSPGVLAIDGGSS